LKAVVAQLWQEQHATVASPDPSLLEETYRTMHTRFTVTNTDPCFNNIKLPKHTAHDLDAA
jgi:hypothetical protein